MHIHKTDTSRTIQVNATNAWKSVRLHEITLTLADLHDDEWRTLIITMGYIIETDEVIIGASGHHREHQPGCEGCESGMFCETIVCTFRSLGGPMAIPMGLRYILRIPPVLSEYDQFSAMVRVLRASIYPGPPTGHADSEADTEPYDDYREALFELKPTCHAEPCRHNQPAPQPRSHNILSRVWSWLVGTTED